MDEMAMGRLKNLTRARIGQIWQSYKKGNILKDTEEQRVAKVLAEHKEYYKWWDMADDLGDKEVVIDGANPFLHITIQAIIENQIAQNDPPVVKATVERLERKGIDRHEIIHRAGMALTSQIFNIFKNETAFNEKEYIEDIKNIELEFK